MPAVRKRGLTPMPAMIDVRCRHCRKRYGYCGEPRDCPACPYCSAEPDRAALDHDQEQMDEFRTWLSEWKDRKKLARPGRVRMAAGLSLGQAAKLLGVGRELLAKVETGEVEPSADLTARMAETYGIS
jgi:DNA-binding XRE family transcriptional regulator